MEDVIIRPYRAEDAADLFEAALESVAEVFPWLMWCHPGYTRAEAENWAAIQERAFAEGSEYEFVIADESGRYLGGCGLNHLNAIDRVANLGYWIRTSAAGRGVATAAVAKLVRFAFTETNLERLEIVCAVGNHASRRVAEKSGAFLEGTARHRIYLHGAPTDAAVYSILRTDPAR